MNDEKKIEQLLAAFYSGQTTPDEEAFLLNYFNENEVKEKFQVDSEIFKGLYDPSRIPLPEGVSERLETALRRHTSASKVRRLFIGISSAAAIALLCIGIFLSTGRSKDFVADTFKNPAEAAIAAEQALLLVSSKLNQGFAPYEKFREAINKTDEIINENLTIN